MRGRVSARSLPRPLRLVVVLSPLIGAIAAVVVFVWGGLAAPAAFELAPETGTPAQVDATSSEPDGERERSSADSRDGPSSSSDGAGAEGWQDLRTGAAADPDRDVSDEPASVAQPVRVEIPAIDVDAEVVPVGLLPDGAMEVPDFGLAGWYTKGPKPGQQGPAVIAAHVDSRAGPDVFFRLGELEPGDVVHVHGEDGSLLTFEVEHQEQTPKDELPVERIWGPTEEPVLRLITCDGFFDRASGHYLDNRVVYLGLDSD